MGFEPTTPTLARLQSNSPTKCNSSETFGESASPNYWHPPDGVAIVQLSALPGQLRPHTTVPRRAFSADLARSSLRYGVTP
jgi:hypothetical protein